MSSTAETSSSPSSRRKSALVRVAQKRLSVTPVVNLNCLVRVFLLDGSSKVLQMFENSTACDVLVSLKFNLDLDDISTYALFRVAGHLVRRIELTEKITDVLRDSTESGQDVRLLFRSWITYRYGGYEKEVFQDDVLVKQPNTALWLAYMEATFMCMTGKYYLTEEESLLLGCLKMQAESGDFNPAIHSLKIMKHRVENRFPNPVRARMKALSSPTLTGNGLADDLAIRAQLLYARAAGKLKLEAQIDFLNCLRMWCPFYGCTFFEVQCQYDYNPLDSSSTPPVLMMNAAVGPLAMFLITTSDPPVIMRHPYKRIIKWIAHADKHIFTYWVIKAEVTLAQIEELEENHSGSGDFDARPYCDCVYLVTSQVKELEYLVHSYVQCRRSVSPCLPGAPEELQDIPAITSRGNSESEPSGTNSRASAATSSATARTPPPVPSSPAPPPPPPAHPPMQRRASRLGVFLSALGGSSSTAAGGTGSGLADEAAEENYGDDTAAVGNSLFKNMYKANAPSRATADDSDEDADAILKQIPAGIKYASTMSELQKVASETNFSDNEESSGEDEASGSDEGTGSGGKYKTKSKGKSGGKGKHAKPKPPSGSPTKKPGAPPPPPPPPPPMNRRPSLLMKASNLIFGGGTNNSNEVNDEEDSDGGSEDSGDNLGGKNNRSNNKGRRKQNDSSDEDN